MVLKRVSFLLRLASCWVQCRLSGLRHHLVAGNDEVPGMTANRAVSQAYRQRWNPGSANRSVDHLLGLPIWFNPHTHQSMRKCCDIREWDLPKALPLGTKFHIQEQVHVRKIGRRPEPSLQIEDGRVVVPPDYIGHILAEPVFWIDNVPRPQFRCALMT